MAWLVKRMELMLAEKSIIEADRITWTGPLIAFITDVGIATKLVSTF